jgi:hypothetical protein
MEETVVAWWASDKRPGRSLTLISSLAHDDTSSTSAKQVSSHCGHP